jgi:CRP-like cAMP-binding protein
MSNLSPAIEGIIAQAETVTFNCGEVLGEQYAKTNNLFILLDGEVTLYYHIVSMEQEVAIGKASFKYAPLGVNLFQYPFRNESTVRITSETATLLKWSGELIHDILEQDINVAIEFFYFFNTKAHELIRETTELFAQTHIVSKIYEDFSKISSGYVSIKNQDQLENVIFLLQSPFMEVFEENELMQLAGGIVRKEYKTGEIVNLQGHKTKGIYILESGEVQFSRINEFRQESYNVMFRSISTPGYLIGSSGTLKEESLVTSRVSRASVILHIPSHVIDDLCESNKSFALNLQKRTLWLIINQLRGIRARLIAAEFDEEHIVSTGLIESNNTKLNINSALHKVPHLLGDKMTIKEGLKILHDVELKGSASEKNLASLCLDNLHQTQKEAKFYDGLKDIYNSVALAPEEYDSNKVQFDCMVSTRKAFLPASVMIKGYENLPDEPGNIFIYNHLLNDPYYTLPNQFQITLDSHFISSLLFEKYNDVGQRIVRVGKNVEYGHQEYYERLSFIDVYTDDSEKIEETPEQKEERKESLFQNIETQLGEGKNVIVSPEGSSYRTEQSPGPFKSGMFRMALQMKKEPLIVPIIIANFDKRIRNNKFACQIKKPFLLSEQMKQKGAKDVKSFLFNYRKEYKKDVKMLTKEVS